ncbi:hypothetical protein ECHHL_0640 [Ehrlichia chaffeensis str. Heartland]|uniref:Uncharacterized protein n=1 Tax=Ehrlichia chaffeensis (strain ATCC CRL-10679 / Arkansas) TaxID=205920 RepID=Q2GGA8_EHRCR|nr:hypothetical protein [Ehrlichia chaffeensis]ABD44821.1 hypothetical protein ECH_0722 [Ehrlichia chaffeensis str. Arkansas]AHX03792.1 hypothetical protein ECHHL_0640 [Ehrlichia chaffeensis str. Heartland]AHX05482.1 hypothetical protein ECHJAX_0412 [Ehrlichia chaffeensis str. Jax]AHX06470.1 hypothetical protein ECHLIB_0409 [Ehrlichia chaffeensis str. Liberty]AHX07413.1 hypothetical protein ECHOSC_0653 [Ehrlichia chaffeensis str. Osceola]
MAKYHDTIINCSSLIAIVGAIVGLTLCCTSKVRHGQAYVGVFVLILIATLALLCANYKKSISEKYTQLNNYLTKFSSEPNSSPNYYNPDTGLSTDYYFDSSVRPVEMPRDEQVYFYYEEPQFHRVCGMTTYYDDAVGNSVGMKTFSGINDEVGKTNIAQGIAEESVGQIVTDSDVEEVTTLEKEQSKVRN